MAAAHRLDIPTDRLVLSTAAAILDMDGHVGSSDERLRTHAIRPPGTSDIGARVISVMFEECPWFTIAAQSTRCTTSPTRTTRPGGRRCMLI
jgi:hypothetical protein